MREKLSMRIYHQRLVARKFSCAKISTITVVGKSHVEAFAIKYQVEELYSLAITFKKRTHTGGTHPKMVCPVAEMGASGAGSTVNFKHC